MDFDVRSGIGSSYDDGFRAHVGVSDLGKAFCHLLSASVSNSDQNDSSMETFGTLHRSSYSFVVSTQHTNFY